MRLVPRSLFGRLVIILVLGMVAAQILTSSIWYDVRRSQVLEIPARLTASRLADVLRLLQHNPAHSHELFEALQSPELRLRWLDLPAGAAPLNSSDHATERLLSEVLANKLGQPVTLHLLDVQVLNDQGKAAGLMSLFGSHMASGFFRLEVQSPDGRWLQVDVQEHQGWTSLSPSELIFDYFLRIYLLRVLIVALIALWAVRLAIRPLNELAQAAEALGRDIRRAPLSVHGPLEVRRAAQAFNRMQQQLISHLAERGRYLAAISHDLRTPITRLRLRTEMLADEDSKVRMRKDLDYMEAMTNATLEFVSSGEVNETRRTVDINALLLSLQADFQDIGHDIALRGRASCTILGYASSLKRCMQNLLENAVRYASQVEMAVEESEDELRLIVRDRGPGIPAELLDQVLEPFYRLEGSRNADTGGHGLGLSIAQTVALAHGGSLHLHARDGGGLEVCVRLQKNNASPT